MKKKLKAFTLIELIIVMAIMAILMVALMNFYKPIRETYVDSTMIEDMRTTQDGILEYLTENVRYAEKMLIIDQGATYSYSYEYTSGSTTAKKSGSFTVTQPDQAYKAFCLKYGYNKDDSSAEPDEVKYEKTLKNVHVIVLNRFNQYDINGNVATGSKDGYHGRIITNIIDGVNTPLKFDNFIGARPNGVDNGLSYMALGGAYYGESDYALYIDMDKTWGTDGKYSGSITFTVQNALANDGGIIKNGKYYGGSTVAVDNGGNVTLTSSKAALTKNLSDVEYIMVNNKKPGDAGAAPAGSITGTGNITAGNMNTYIVYVDPDDER